MRLRTRVAGLVIGAAGLAACSPPIVRPVLLAPEAAPKKTDIRDMLKLHLRNGELYVLDTWRLDEEGGRIEGTGRHYDALRQPLPAGGRKSSPSKHSVPISEVALVEAERPEDWASHGAATLASLSLVSAVVAVRCAVDPKGCFGSCPTFYLDGHDNGRPLAEGFSSSIARVLEARDVDALFGVPPRSGGRLHLVMRNEALETQAIRRVRLLVTPRPAGGRVLAAPDGRFYEARALQPPLGCRAPEGDCRAAVSAWDDLERSSLADEKDLAAREEIELDFPPARGAVGLVVGARQALLSTFLFYQTMAYLGSEAGTFLASLERSEDLAYQAMGLARELGGIEVAVAEGDSDYHAVGRFDEAGPIAGDVQVVPFALAGAAPCHVRLRLTKGHWRIGYLALATLGATVEPRALDPLRVERDGREDVRTEELWRRGREHLITLPGDVRRLEFQLPKTTRPLELFLESQGFYYEWMRKEWLADEDPELAALVLGDPRAALRRMAAAYKEREPTLEKTFWASRFRR